MTLHRLRSALSILWGVCVLAPIGLGFLFLEAFFGVVAIIVFTVALDFKNSAQMRVSLYNDLREPVAQWFRVLRHELREFTR